MLCAACNKAVHSRCTLALGKAWHAYHFVCSICRVVLQEDNYATLPDDSITCIDCLNSSNNKQTSKSTGSISRSTYSKEDSISYAQPHTHHTHSLSPTLRSASSPCLLLPDTSRPTLNPLHNSFSGLTGPRGLHSDSSPSTLRQDIALDSSVPRELEPTIKHTFTELDPNEQFSNSKSTLFYRRLLSPSNATNHTQDAYSSAPSLSAYREQSPNASAAPSQFHADDSTQNTKSIQNTDESKASEDSTEGLFSSDFYKSYYYRKSYSMNTLDSIETSIPSTPSTPISSSTSSLTEPLSTLADKTINREKRLSRKSRHSIETRPIELPPSDSTNESESVFSDSFYKKNYQINKKFDFEFIDKTAPPPIESFQATSEDSKGSTNNQKSLPEDPTSLAETLLDTSEDMKARGRLWTSSTHRKPPPSMGIRVSVPMPYFRKPEPVATPPPAPSPSPPLSLPSSPSPPPNAISSSPLPLNTPPSSPHLSRKPQQGYGLQPNPPLSSPVPILSRSASPPLSLPAEANGKELTQNMTARIEEEIVRLVMERVQLGTSSDMDKGASVASVSGGASSSSLMARKRRLKQAHKEATLQRQLSLHKGLVTEVLATNLKLRKVTTGSGAKSSRQELADAIRAFPLASLRKSQLVKYEDSHMIHMKNIRCFERSGKLKQVVGNTTASQLLPIVNYLVWIGKNCVGMSFRDIQYLLRDPVACRDLCSRLALRYRGTSADDDNSNKAKNADVGEVDCIVAVPHEAAIAFGARLSAQLRIPLQVLLQRHSKSTSQSSFTNKSNNSSYGSNSSSNSTAPMFPSGRGLYGVGVESLQTRGEAYELWLARSHCIRRDYRALVIDDVLDNGAPLVAAMMILRAAGARVVEMVTVVEYNGFGGRERVAHILSYHSFYNYTSNKL